VVVYKNVMVLFCFLLHFIIIAAKLI